MGRRQYLRGTNTHFPLLLVKLPGHYQGMGEGGTTWSADLKGNVSKSLLCGYDFI